MPDKPSRATFQERINYFITSIREDIINGKIASGDFLPSLNLLSIQYNLSKNSLQKGLDKLVLEALIERVPRVGIRVLENVQELKTVIRFGYYPSLEKTAYIRHLVEQYELDNPLVEVKLIPLQYENYKDVVSHYLSAGMLDLVAISDINFNQLAEDDHMSGNLFEGVSRNSEMYSFLYDSYENNNLTYAVPFIYSPVILCYRKDHFEKGDALSLSKQLKWSDFLEELDNVRNERKNQFRFYFNPTSNNRWPIFLLQSGIPFNDEVIVDKSEMGSLLSETISTSYKLIHNQKLISTHFTSDDTKVEDLFLMGKISVMMTTYLGLNDLIGSDIGFEIMPLPYVSEPGTLLLSVGLALNRYSKNKQATKSFIDYLTSYDAQLEIRKKTLTIPARKDAAEWEGSEQIQRPENFKIYQKLIPTFKLLADMKISHQERIRILNGLRLYWMGLESEDTTITSISEILNNR